MRDVFKSVTRGAVEAAHTLQAADKETTRKQLKKQSAAFHLKLETSRTASTVALTNQKAELDATHERVLQVGRLRVFNPAS